MTGPGIFNPYADAPIPSTSGLGMGQGMDEDFFCEETMVHIHLSKVSNKICIIST